MDDVLREGLLVNVGDAYSPRYVLTERGIHVATEVVQYRHKLSEQGMPRKLDHFRYKQDFGRVR